MCICLVGACDHLISYLIFGEQYENAIKRESAVSTKFSFTFSETKTNKDKDKCTETKELNVKRLQRKLRKLNVSQIRKNLIISRNPSIQSERQKPQNVPIKSQKSRSLVSINLHVTPEPSCNIPRTPTLSNAMAVSDEFDDIKYNGLNVNGNNHNDGLSPSLCALHKKFR